MKENPYVNIVDKLPPELEAAINHPSTIAARKRKIKLAIKYGSGLSTEEQHKKNKI